MPNATRETVFLSELLGSPDWEAQSAKLPLALGKDISGSPIMVDFTTSAAQTGNGIVDRIYLTDTLGRIFKINTAMWGSSGLCYLGSLGESIYSSMAVEVLANQQVNLYVGGGPDPNAYNPTSQQYHFAKFEDFDAINQCKLARVGFMNALPMGQKVWAGPVVSAGSVFVATTGAAILDPADDTYGVNSCSNNTGSLIEFNTGSGGIMSNVSINGIVVGGLRAFDGHIFANGISGTSTLFGANNWNSPPLGQGGQLGGTGLPTTFWSQP